ncbi:MAG: DUF3618 domain-containing protein [Polyangiaceae bacterium]
MDTAASPLNEETTSEGIPVSAPEEGESEEAIRLRAEIAATRENIGSTIGALQQKLSPAALAEQAKTVVRDATIGKVENMVHDAEYRITRTGYSFLDTIRENPIPAAMAAIGIAWLFMNRRSASEYGGDYNYNYNPNYDARWGRRFDRRQGLQSDFRQDLGDVGRRVEGAAEQAGQTLSDKAHDVGQAISDKAQQAGHAISDTAHDVGQAITDKANQAGQAMKEYAGEIEEQGRRLETRLEQVYRDNPIAVGAVVLAAGTAVGLAIPISRVEDQWLGAARDEVMDKAANLAHETLEKVESAAKQAGSVAGLATDLTQKADRAIQDAR